MFSFSLDKFFAVDATLTPTAFSLLFWLTKYTFMLFFAKVREKKRARLSSHTWKIFQRNMDVGESVFDFVVFNKCSGILFFDHMVLLTESASKNIEFCKFSINVIFTEGSEKPGRHKPAFLPVFSQVYHGFLNREKFTLISFLAKNVDSSYIENATVNLTINKIVFFKVVLFKIRRIKLFFNYQNYFGFLTLQLSSLIII